VRYYILACVLPGIRKKEDLFYFIFCFYLGMGDERRGFGHSWGKVKCRRERQLINFLCSVEKWLFIFGILNFGH